MHMPDKNLQGFKAVALERQHQLVDVSVTTIGHHHPYCLPSVYLTLSHITKVPGLLPPCCKGSKTGVRQGLGTTSSAVMMTSLIPMPLSVGLGMRLQLQNKNVYLLINCRVNVTFIDRDDERHEVKGKVGDNVLYLAHRHGIEMEGEFHAEKKCPSTILNCHMNNVFKVSEIPGSSP